MPPRDAFIGLDLGTTSVKGVLVDADGKRLATADRSLALSEPEPLGAEQDPREWWEASAGVLRALAESAAKRGDLRVAAVGLTGQKHALLPLGADGTPLSPAVLWCDGRATAEAEEAEDLLPHGRLARRTGSPAHPGCLAPKWMRFRRRSPEKALATARLVFAKDYVRLRLTGAFLTDRTEASASLLYDVGGKIWSPELLAAFEVPPSALPPVVRSGDPGGRVSAEGEAATGISRGALVAGGAGDNEAAALGCGATGEGRVAVVLGTSGTVVAHHLRRGAAGGLVWGRHALRHGYAATGVVMSAGRAVEWVRRAVFPADFTVEELVAAAQASDPAEGPLVFMPSLAGERSPVPDAGASGAFVGLRPGHGRGHLARAVLEGVEVAVAEVAALLRGAGVAVTELRATSGGARSPFWLSLIAAAANLPVVRAGDSDGPALGAAMLAARCTGRHGTLAAIAGAWVLTESAVTAEPAEVERLSGLAATLRSTRNALRSVGAPSPRRARKGAGGTSVRS